MKLIKILVMIILLVPLTVSADDGLDELKENIVEEMYRDEGSKTIKTCFSSEGNKAVTLDNVSVEGYYRIHKMRTIGKGRYFKDVVYPINKWLVNFNYDNHSCLAEYSPSEGFINIVGRDSTFESSLAHYNKRLNGKPGVLRLQYSILLFDEHYNMVEILTKEPQVLESEKLLKTFKSIEKEIKESKESFNFLDVNVKVEYNKLGKTKFRFDYLFWVIVFASIVLPQVKSLFKKK